MSSDLYHAVFAFTRSVRCNLPIVGEPLEWTREVQPIHRELVAEKQGLATFSRFLGPVPEELTPEGLLLRIRNLQVVGEAFRAAHAAIGSPGVLLLLRRLWNDLMETPLFCWRWTGKVLCKQDTEGRVLPEDWLPIETHLCAVDGQILDELLKAVPVVTPLPSPPKRKLMGWPEILDYVQRSYDRRNQERVGRLNDLFNGPIVMPKKGGQPFVDAEKLSDWWNQLDERLAEAREEERREQENIQETLRESYPHGRNGTVLPNLAGHIKGRRTKKNPSSQ
jgi:hypothetical protein